VAEKKRSKDGIKRGLERRPLIRKGPEEVCPAQADHIRDKRTKKGTVPNPRRAGPKKKSFKKEENRSR